MSRQKDTRRGALHSAIQTIGKELAKYRPHRPREINRGKIPAKHHIRTVDKRSVFVRTGDNLPSAGDDQQQYRPHESPANGRITNGAGDAGGILLDLVTEDHTSNRPRSADFDHGPSKPPRTPLTQRRGSLTARALTPPCCVLQNDLYTHPCQAGRTSRRGPGVVTPACPRLSFSRMLLDGPEGSAEEIE